MYGIGDFFKKFKAFHTKEVLSRTIICEIIKKYTGAEILPKNISFKNDIVSISDISSSLRSAIYIKKLSILRDLGQAITGRIIKDIK